METWYELVGQYGYIAIFLLFTLGIVGLPVPDEILLTYLGFVTSTGQMHLILTFVSAFAGALCGISISYVLGLKLGEPFLLKFGPKLFIKEKAITRTNQLFHKYGSLVLFICYFIPGVRHVAAYLAGITRFSFKRFSLFAYTGAFVWVATFITIGNRLGENWQLITRYFNDYIWLVVILVTAAVITGLLYYFIRCREKR
ncbi:DedA family protein [Lentibacillus sp. N15]|uniref:DedA family protein n=1 Tax=Lentibacillus songyuanensis TaxID=3136161 RepID=UPI0031BA3B99